MHGREAPYLHDCKSTPPRSQVKRRKLTGSTHPSGDCKPTFDGKFQQNGSTYKHANMAARKKLSIVLAGCLSLNSCKCSNKQFWILSTTLPNETFADGCLHSRNSCTLFEAFLLHGNNRHPLMSWKYSGFAAWLKARTNNKNKLLLCDTKITIV